MRETIEERLLTSRKYKDVCPDTIRRLIAETKDRYRKEKEQEKAIRETLHGIMTAFMSEEEIARLERCAEKLERGDDAMLTEILGMHASTRERLPLERADHLFDELFAKTGIPSSLIDLACGLEPVYMWSRYPACAVTACDINGACVRFLNERLPESGIRAFHVDLLCMDPGSFGHHDVALLFKILPLLERQKKGSAADLLERLDVGHAVVSFPTRTIGGRNVGMEKHYSDWIEEIVPENFTETARLVTENELYCILEKNRLRR